MCNLCICIINVLPNALLKAGSGIYCIGRLKGRVLFMFCGVILNSSPFLRRQLSCWCPFTVKFKCCVKSPVLQNSCVNILYTFWDKSFIFFQHSDRRRLFSQGTALNSLPLITFGQHIRLFFFLKNLLKMAPK